MTVFTLVLLWVLTMWITTNILSMVKCMPTNGRATGRFMRKATLWRALTVYTVRVSTSNSVPSSGRLRILRFDYDDVLADGIWQQFFTEKPEILTREEKRAWLDTMTGVALGSDAFFPFGDNIERAHKSGVSYIAQPGGSVRDDHVIGTCDKYNMAMAFTGIRLFHH